MKKDLIFEEIDPSEQFKKNLGNDPERRGDSLWFATKECCLRHIGVMTLSHANMDWPGCRQ